MIKVLVTGAGAVLGQGIFRALRQSSLDAYIICADPQPLSAALYWGDAARLIPMAHDPSFIDAFSRVLREERPEVVLVGTDAELPIFAEHRLGLEAEHHTKILVSDPAVVEIADDKYRTFEFFRDRDLNPPLSALVDQPLEVERLVDEVGFPLVVKPRRGARSVGVSVVRSLPELRQATANRPGLIIQECVGTDANEYTASALVFDGEAQATVVMRRDLRDGNTYRAYADHYEELNAMVRQFGTALQPYGPANFQFRLDSAGRARVFEINARFSGATPLRALVGFNEVELCIRKLLFGEAISQPRVRPATILRHWSETVIDPRAPGGIAR